MPGHGHVTALIGTNKAYVKGLKYISCSIFTSKVIYVVVFMMEFASLESKIQMI